MCLEYTKVLYTMNYSSPKGKPTKRTLDLSGDSPLPRKSPRKIPVNSQPAKITLHDYKLLGLSLAFILQTSFILRDLCYSLICATIPTPLVNVIIQVNKKFRKFGRKYRDCIKRNGDKIGTQTCYDIST